MTQNKSQSKKSPCLFDWAQSPYLKEWEKALPKITVSLTNTEIRIAIVTRGCDDLHGLYCYDPEEIIKKIQEEYRKTGEHPEKHCSLSNQVWSDANEIVASFQDELFLTKKIYHLPYLVKEDLIDKLSNVIYADLKSIWDKRWKFSTTVRFGMLDKPDNI